jgi:hypothetical protein
MRLKVAVLIVFTLAACSTALGVGGVAGTYATTITSPPQLKGKWVLTLGKGRAYKVALNGRALGRGTWSATAKTITFVESAGFGCGGSGTYAWKKSGKTLRFTRKREAASCQARAAVLAHRFTQVR